MSLIWRRAPRFFTGAAFPEEVSRELLSFTQRHNLKSDVWVPKKLVGKLKKGTSLVPNAILCDVSLMKGCGLTVLKAIGLDRILVNAAQTTDREFIENYHKNIVQGSFLFGYLPLMQSGAPQSETRLNEFELIAKQQGFKSFYWIKRGYNGRRWINAEETHYPGRYNPTDCTLYDPHTCTNLSFPNYISLLMKRKASRFGYTSRTWLTQKEGELHGTQLHIKRMKDGPPIFVSYFSGQGKVYSLEYFCADQFDNFLIFPTSREIDLAASGVFIGLEKVKSYPILSSLASESSTATRHCRMAKELPKFSNPILFGVTSSSSKYFNNFFTLKPEFKEQVRKFSLLRGFSHPYFILHNSDISTQLRLKKSQEQGVTYSLPDNDNLSFSSQKNYCFFNMDQFEEPLVVKELIERTPKHFFIQIPLRGSLLIECARTQITMKNFSNMWIPSRALDYIGEVWKLLPDAIGVPKDLLPNNNLPIMYSTSDINIPLKALEWWPTYFPCDNYNKLHLGEVKMLLSMRAWEQHYTSPIWVTQTLANNIGAVKRRRGKFKTYLKGHPFENPPTVIIGNDEYINIEEFKNPKIFELNIDNSKVDKISKNNEVPLNNEVIE